MSDRSDTLNLQDFPAESSVGKYHIPTIAPENLIPDELIDFCHSLRSQRFSCGVHFFLDDYRFERIWRSPWRYISRLRKFSAVLAPDFSLYMDMPTAMKIWNVYRSRLLGQMMQRAGCRVIPVISWADEDSFEYCFDGITPGTAVAVSTVGAMYSRKCRRLFLRGFEAMTAKLHPDKIVIYGKIPDEIELGDREIVSFPSTSWAWKYDRRGVSYGEKR